MNSLSEYILIENVKCKHLGKNEWFLNNQYSITNMASLRKYAKSLRFGNVPNAVYSTF